MDNGHCLVLCNATPLVQCCWIIILFHCDQIGPQWVRLSDIDRCSVSANHRHTGLSNFIMCRCERVVSFWSLLVSLAVQSISACLSVFRGRWQSVVVHQDTGQNRAGGWQGVLLLDIRQTINRRFCKGIQRIHPIINLFCSMHSFSAFSVRCDSGEMNWVVKSGLNDRDMLLTFMFFCYLLLSLKRKRPMFCSRGSLVRAWDTSLEIAHYEVWSIHHRLCGWVGIYIWWISNREQAFGHLQLCWHLQPQHHLQP